MSGKNHPDHQIAILTASYCSLADEFVPGPFTELDMGCGNGSFTTQLAQRYADRRIFASDVMLGRLRKLQKRNNRLGVPNVRCLRVESRHLMGYMIPDGALDRLHLLCPDPWPKEKHRANRLMSSDFYGQIFRVLNTDGIFHFASDEADYFASVSEQILISGLFEPAFESIADIADIHSDFEKRWLLLGKPVQHGAWRKVIPTGPFIGH